MSDINIPTMAEMAAQGKEPEILFWVGCAGSFDERAQRITRDLCKILNHVGISFAVLGTEESCTGDPAKRAGNEFLFQMQAMVNIQVLDGYNIKKIVTGCPHCFNTIKNEYPGLGGNYEVMHHTQLLQQLIDEGKLKAEGGEREVAPDPPLPLAETKAAPAEKEQRCGKGAHRHANSRSLGGVPGIYITAHIVTDRLGEELRIKQVAEQESNHERQEPAAFIGNGD